MTAVPSKLFPDFPESFFSNTADSKDFLFAVASEFGQCFYSSSEQASFCSGRHSRLHNRNRRDVIADKLIFFLVLFLVPFGSSPASVHILGHLSEVFCIPAAGRHSICFDKVSADCIFSVGLCSYC